MISYVMGVIHTSAPPVPRSVKAAVHDLTSPSKDGGLKHKPQWLKELYPQNFKLVMTSWSSGKD